MKGLEVSHLHSVDDNILFLLDNKLNFQQWLSLLQIFEVIPMLCINLSKCGLVGVNV